MRAWWILAASAVVALLTVWSLAHVLPADAAWVTSVLYGLIIAGSGLGTMFIRKRAERGNRTAEEGSIERDIAQRAASGSFSVCLVAMVFFALYLVLQNQIGHALVLYLLLWAVIVIHWLRDVVIRQELS